MRISKQRDRDGSWLIRMFGKHGECAYAVVGLSGPVFEVSFPSDWHEEKRGWFRIGCGLLKVAFQFPWPWVSEDDGQCSGHTYGFVFFDKAVHVHWGKGHGTRDDQIAIFYMPWSWRYVRDSHVKLGNPEGHYYTYRLRSGEVQPRVATIQAEVRRYWRPWFPWRRVDKSISVTFSGEVGEKTGSWKGGTIGCWYEMLPGEDPEQTLRRMEKTRKF